MASRMHVVAIMAALIMDAVNTFVAIICIGICATNAAAGLISDKLPGGAFLFLVRLLQVTTTVPIHDARFWEGTILPEGQHMESDTKLISVLTIGISALFGLIVWSVKVAVPSLLTSYRNDLLLSQTTLQKALEEVTKELKEARTSFIEELRLRDKVVERLSNVVDKLVYEVKGLMAKHGHNLSDSGEMEVPVRSDKHA